ncbi:MAG: threonylcarbamoyl-AMP synthase [Prevotellaceae bacterium]|jgi:tRNA threonylcarbamoyl adenosine modification protein (Sua5/YciO/YrdC/YwlC family)|nr:threonylcarbamoyl-AMP synthase [Prevotellaceae bacterium]
MIVKIHPDSPSEREINRVVKILQNDGVVIYPTDSVYAMGCSLRSKKGFEKIVKIKNIHKKEKATFSLICESLSNLSDYAKVDTPTFKVLKKNLPGAFTFILTASNRVPEKLLGKRKQIGLRIPDNKTVMEIVKHLECPLLSTSIRLDDDFIEYIGEPELINEKFGKLADICIDGGTGGLIPSTIVDCTNDEFEIIRQGKGELIM